MALDVGRWWKYAQAKLSRAVDDANADLDDLEAEHRARAEGKPWLDADGTAPTMDEAKARIEHEVATQSAGPAGGGPAATPGAPTAAPSEGAAPAADESADVAQARVELDRQARASKERLAAIRKELGVDPPEGPPPSP